MSYRLFLAIDLPEKTRESLFELCSGITKVRWMPIEQFHLTIRFIGDSSKMMVEDICEALEDFTFEPFDLTIKDTGYFPPGGDPKVLWTGIESNQTLKKLYKNINTSLTKCGIAREGRKFHPHITLGRVKGESLSSLGDWLSATSRFQSDPIRIDSFHLYNSRLTPDGAIHDKLCSF